MVAEGLPDPLAGLWWQRSGGRRVGILQLLWVLADCFAQEPDLREVSSAPDADQEMQPDCKAIMQGKGGVERGRHHGRDLVAARRMPDEEISQPDWSHVIGFKAP